MLLTWPMSSDLTVCVPSRSISTLLSSSPLSPCCCCTGMELGLELPKSSSGGSDCRLGGSADGAPCASFANRPEASLPAFPAGTRVLYLQALGSPVCYPASRQISAERCLFFFSFSFYLVTDSQFGTLCSTRFWQRSPQLHSCHCGHSYSAALNGHMHMHTQTDTHTDTHRHRHTQTDRHRHIHTYTHTYTHTRAH